LAGASFCVFKRDHPTMIQGVTRLPRDVDFRRKVYHSDVPCLVPAPV
jgi:hypothetical protein